ncbi:hypothetical protein JCM11251_002274 [Rhodosporidiobolus azoricus]
MSIALSWEEALTSGVVSAADRTSGTSAAAMEVEANLPPLHLILRSLSFRLALRALSAPPAHLLHKPEDALISVPAVLSSLPPASLVGFSDGSLMEGFTGAALAVWVKDDDEAARMSLRVLGGQQTVWAGKAEGARLTILTALPLLQLRHSPSLTLLIDNQALLLAPTDPSPTSGQHLCLQLRSLLTHLNTAHPTVSVCFVWCPGHEGVEGNELVDLIAKEAAEEGARRAEGAMTRKAGIAQREATMTEWQRRWLGDAGIGLHAFLPPSNASPSSTSTPTTPSDPAGPTATAASPPSFGDAPSSPSPLSFSPPPRPASLLSPSPPGTPPSFALSTSSLVEAPPFSPASDLTFATLAAQNECWQRATLFGSVSVETGWRRGGDSRPLSTGV